MRSPRPAFLSTVLAVAALAPFVTACGSSSPRSSTSASSSGPPSAASIRQAEHDAVKFARCMRAHGVSDFEDPTSPFEFKQSFNVLAAKNSPGFQSADDACSHLLPGNGEVNQSPAQTHAHTVALLAFAHCLRSHGFPNFPDPNTTGQVTREMIAGAGINLQQPAVVHVADACTSATHGVITRAVVARFLAGH